MTTIDGTDAAKAEEAAAELFKTEPPEFSERSLKVAALPEDPGAEAPPKLLRSIEAYGVVQPIVVREVFTKVERTRIDGEHDPEPGQMASYVVVDGKRRLSAARQLGIKRIRARIFSANGWTPDALTVTLNTARGANVAAELDAIERLIREGMDEAMISRRTGMPIGTLRQRMKLLALVVELRTALRNGRLAPSVAERAVRLSGAAQTALAATAGPEGRVTAKMVAEANAVKRETALAGLDLPPAVAADWRDEVAGALRFAAEHARDHDGNLAEDIEALRVEVTGELTALAEDQT